MKQNLSLLRFEISLDFHGLIITSERQGKLHDFSENIPIKHLGENNLHDNGDRTLVSYNDLSSITTDSFSNHRRRGRDFLSRKKGRHLSGVAIKVGVDG